MRERHQRVATEQHVVQPDVFLQTVKPGSTRSEEYRRDSRTAQNRVEAAARRFQQALHAQRSQKRADL